jgi:hypothetical protein
MITTKNSIILNDHQASSHFGDNWQYYFTVINSGTIFFDGFEVFPEIELNGIQAKLVLVSVYDDVDFESIYN